MYVCYLYTPVLFDNRVMIDLQISQRDIVNEFNKKVNFFNLTRRYFFLFLFYGIFIVTNNFDLAIYVFLGTSAIALINKKYFFIDFFSKTKIRKEINETKV